MAVSTEGLVLTTHARLRRRERRRGSKRTRPIGQEAQHENCRVPCDSKDHRKQNEGTQCEEEGSRASMGALLTVFRRGAGATPRPQHVPQRWGKRQCLPVLLRNGRPSNPNYKTTICCRRVIPAQSAPLRTLIPQPTVGSSKGSDLMTDEEIVSETEMVEARRWKPCRPNSSLPGKRD